jgi:hypothetical protein
MPMYIVENWAKRATGIIERIELPEFSPRANSGDGFWRRFSGQCHIFGE